MPVRARSAFTIAAAALAGSCMSVCAVRWWARHTSNRPPARPLPPRQAPEPAAPQEILHSYWSTLQPLDLTS
ncbi:hypothetical protein ABZ876_29875 [Streptomyces sp. NPDC046931]|uniref:hypothetical protein n=1 Tax=Streptomyces sp. NPDC046931 TaxID=3154806 RepID=UPI0033CB898F